MFVERGVVTPAVMQWVEHCTPVTHGQEHSAVMIIGGMLASRGQISLTAIALLLAPCL
jgi:hypothetical protein